MSLSRAARVTVRRYIRESTNVEAREGGRFARSIGALNLLGGVSDRGETAALDKQAMRVLQPPFLRDRYPDTTHAARTQVDPRARARAILSLLFADARVTPCLSNFSPSFHTSSQNELYRKMKF